MSCHRIDPGCLNQSLTVANSHWGQVSLGEMIYKNEGTEKPLLPPQEREGLNSEQALTIGRGKRTLLHPCPRFYLQQLSAEVSGASFLQRVRIYELAEWWRLSRPEPRPLSGSLCFPFRWAVNWLIISSDALNSWQSAQAEPNQHKILITYSFH